MSFAYRKISDLTPLENNPRYISKEDMDILKESIKENPDYFEARPLILSDRTGELVIIAGNQRYLAAQSLNMEEVPSFLLSGLTEQREKEIIIRDNISNGKWDYEILANEWNTADLESWGFELPLGYNDSSEPEEDDYVIPKEIQTDIVLGDIFDIGPHKLLCGTSTQTETWKRLMGPEFADLVITDPPYNVDYTGATKDKLKIVNDKQTDGDFYSFLYDFYTACGHYTKPGGGWYVWHADTEGANFRRAMADAGIMVKQCLIWVKSSMVMGRQDYHWQHEPCLYGWKEGAAHSWYADRKQTTILNFDRPNRNGEHPTMKPVPLIAYLIKNSSKPADIVADGFGGSGTTMLACHQMERKCRMIELDPRYCQVIIDRMIQFDEKIVILKNGKPYNKAAA